MERDSRLEQIETRIEEINSRVESFESNVEQLLIEANTDLGTYRWVLNNEEEQLQRQLIEDYSTWLSEVRPLVSKFLPGEPKKFVNWSDQVMDVVDLRVDATDDVPTRQQYLRKCFSAFRQQMGLVKSIPGRVESQRLVGQRQLTSRFAIDETRRARRMYEDGYVRAAGVVGGVALEEQLAAMCDTAEIEYELDDTIGPLAQRLYDADEIDNSDHRLLDWLASVRNECAHFNEEQMPEEDDVKRALDEIERFIDRNSGP